MMTAELPPSPDDVIDAFAAHVREGMASQGEVSGVMLGLSTDLGEAVSVLLENLQLGPESRLALAEKLCNFACGWTRLCDAFALRPSALARGLLSPEHAHVHTAFKERSLTAMRMVSACGTMNQLVDDWIRSGMVDKSEFAAAARTALSHWATLCRQCGLNWRHVLGLAAGSAKNSRTRRTVGA